MGKVRYGYALAFPIFRSMRNDPPSDRHSVPWPHSNPQPQVRKEHVATGKVTKGGDNGVRFLRILRVGMYVGAPVPQYFSTFVHQTILGREVTVRREGLASLFPETQRFLEMDGIPMLQNEIYPLGEDSELAGEVGGSV